MKKLTITITTSKQRAKNCIASIRTHLHSKDTMTYAIEDANQGRIAKPTKQAE